MLVCNFCAVPDGLETKPTKICSEHSAYRVCVCVCVYTERDTNYILGSTRGKYGGLLLSLLLPTLDNSIDAVRGTEVVSCDLSKKSRQLSFPTLK